MSSHWKWAEDSIAKHDLEKPFAPENGERLKFKVGDQVIFTNGYGVNFKLRITGFYRPAEACVMYATGYRYLVDSSSPWFPVKESSLQFNEGVAPEAGMVTCPATARHAGDLVGCGSGNREEFIPSVVMEVSSAAVKCVRATHPIRIILLDEDTEGGDEDCIQEVNGEEAYVADYLLTETADDGFSGIDPTFVADVIEQIKED